MIIEANSTVKSFLENFQRMMQSHTPTGFKYSGFEDFILSHGQNFPIGKSPKAMGRKKECFRNAFIRMQGEGLYYAEGFACGIIPVLHAWNVSKDGFVIDPTWNDGTDYFGVVFKEEFVIQTVLARGYYGVIDNFEQRFPLLRGEGLENIAPKF